MAIKLVSASDVRVYLDVSTTNIDTLLDHLIEQVSADIESYCDRSFKEQSSTEYPVAGGKRLHVERYPIDTGSTITLKHDGNRDFGSGTTVSSDKYDVISEMGYLLVRGKNWVDLERTYQIVYTGGYTETAGVLGVPDDLKRATIMQVAYLFDRRKNIGGTSLSGGEGSMAFDDPYNFLVPVKRILAKYRRYGHV
tara:strand:- start:870 stop:1454 length:585 start_codon:yes stop_codon:yes gene_type:complete